MKDTRTTVSGAIAGICQLIGIFVPGAQVLCDPISALALVLMGYFAADG